MESKLYARIVGRVAASAAVAALLLVPARADAQGARPGQPGARPDGRAGASGGEERGQGAGAAGRTEAGWTVDQEWRIRPSVPEDWTIQPQLNQLTQNMTQFNGLINTLNQANTELGEQFQRYLDDPDNELLASTVERSMAQYAQRVVRDFDRIIADQDVLLSNFRDLQRQLGRFSGGLQEKVEGFQARLGELRDRTRQTEEELCEMAVELRSTSEDDPEYQNKRREFARRYRQFRLQNRYVRGYGSHFRSYTRLVQNMTVLSELFVSLQDKFVELVANLETERQYMFDSVQVQIDVNRIKQIMRDGIVSGERALTNVSQRLAQLYIQVDTFTHVHDRINENLNRFVESQQVLLNVSEMINQIGTGGGDFGDVGNQLDQAIDYFADRQGHIPQEGEEEDDFGLDEDDLGPSAMPESEPGRVEAPAPAPAPAPVPQGAPAPAAGNGR